VKLLREAQRMFGREVLATVEIEATQHLLEDIYSRSAHPHAALKSAQPPGCRPVNLGAHLHAGRTRVS